MARRTKNNFHRMKMCKRLYMPKISLHVILHVVKHGPVLVHIKKLAVVCETHLFGLRTSYDVFVKPTYALLRKERTDILRLIVRSFFMKLAPAAIYQIQIGPLRPQIYLILSSGASFIKAFTTYFRLKKIVRCS